MRQSADIVIVLAETYRTLVSHIFYPLSLTSAATSPDACMTIISCNTAVEAKEQKGWNKIRQLKSLLTTKDASFFMTGKLYAGCLQAC